MQEHECNICNGTEWVINDKGNAEPCKCRAINMYLRAYKKSGLTKLFSTRTFDTFVTDDKPNEIKQAKNTAMKYVKEFDGTESMALLGISGSGKTHLCIAVANELLKQNIGVLYMQYRDALTNLKQNYISKDDSGESIYQKELNKYKLAPVLYIDDLFKGKLTDSDINVMFEIINYRYINNLPILISSEMSCEDIFKVDAAVGGRILEMCKGRIIEFDGINLNHRLQ